MALKTFRPTTPGLRQLVQVDRGHLWKGGPIKLLTEGKTKSGGRNNHGRITTRHIGGGHKQSYRKIDFRRTKHDVPAKVERLFNVKVRAVNTQVRKGKRKTFKNIRALLSDSKRAIMTLEEGHAIDVTTGL